MKEHLHSELKKEFQLERMILFSDAVFAIAITLLVIELKVPEIPHDLISEDRLLESLAEQIPKLIGFVISFFIIGLYWTVHHRLFGYVVNYTQRLLWLNLIFLLAVVFMPFSTGFYSQYILDLFKTPVTIYVVNICFLGIMNYVLWKYVSNPKRGLTEGMSKSDAAYHALRAITVPIVFITMLIFYPFLPKVAIYIPMLMPVIMYVVAKIYKRKKSGVKNK